MTYVTEFPDFALDVAIPEAWEDVSWHNDACPSWIAGRLFVYVDYADPAKREWQDDMPRFAVMEMCDDHTGDTLLATDSWAAVLEFARLHALGQAALPRGEDDWGSDRQVEAENAFFAALDEAGLDADQMERFCLKGTTEENVAHALQALRIGLGFAATVREQLADHLPEIRRRNAAHRANGKNSICATHDFCDANMLMAEAFQAVMGREVDADLPFDADTWNAAWDFAAKRDFAETAAQQEPAR